MRVPLGIRYILLSSLGFSAMGALVKLTSQTGLPILEIIAARALISLILSYVHIQKNRLPLLGNNKPLLILRGLVGTCSLLCVYYSVAHLPFAEATVIQFMNPVFTVILAVIFLSEKVRTVTLICLLLSFSGLLLIVRPESLFGEWSGDYDIYAVFIAILGAFGSSIAYILVRQLNKTDRPEVIIFYFPLVALPCSLLLLGDDFVMPVGSQWILLIAVGIATQVGQLGITKALQTLTASRATSYSYIQVIFATIIGWLVFSEVPDIWVYFGAFLIILGAVMTFWQDFKKESNLP